MTKTALSAMFLVFSFHTFAEDAATDRAFQKVMSYLVEWTNTPGDLTKRQFDVLKEQSSIKSTVEEMNLILQKESSMNVPIFTAPDKPATVILSTQRFLDWNQHFALLPIYANEGDSTFAMIGTFSEKAIEMKNAEWASDRFLIVGIPIGIPRPMNDSLVHYLWDRYIESPQSARFQTNGMNNYPNLGMNLIDWSSCNAIPDAGDVYQVSEATIHRLLNEKKCQPLVSLGFNQYMGFVDYRRKLDVIADEVGFGGWTRKEIREKIHSSASYGVVRGLAGGISHLLAVYQMRALDAYRVDEKIPSLVRRLERPETYLRASLAEPGSCQALLVESGHRVH
jgi:hypothetical protein